jgi:hypothetical protein
MFEAVIMIRHDEIQFSNRVFKKLIAIYEQNISFADKNSSKEILKSGRSRQYDLLNLPLLVVHSENLSENNDMENNSFVHQSENEVSKSNENNGDQQND